MAFSFTLTPTPDQAAQMLVKLLEKAAEGVTKLEVGGLIDVFAPGEMVKIVNDESGNHEVCDACQELQDNSPYPIEVARKLVPHHWMCHCRIRKLKGGTPTWVTQRGFEKRKHRRTRVRKAVRGVKIVERNIAKGIRLATRPTPRQAVAVLKKLGKKRKMVAPRGARMAAWMKKQKGY